MGYKYRVKYNGTILVDGLDISSLYSKTLSCNGKFMNGDIVFETYTEGRLPEGYTEVEYIESSGTQYIRTGFYPLISYNKIILEFMPLAWSGVVAGCQSNNYNACSNIFINTSSTLNMEFGDAIMGSASVQTTSASLDTKYYSEFSNESSAWTWKIGTSESSATTYTGTKSTRGSSFNTDYALFGRHDYSVGTVNNLSTCRIYSCKLYNSSDTITMNLVPCYNSSNVAGMYDLIGGSFLTNSGTGTFIVGPDVY